MQLFPQNTDEMAFSGILARELRNAEKPSSGSHDFEQTGMQYMIHNHNRSLVSQEKNFYDMTNDTLRYICINTLL